MVRIKYVHQNRDFYMYKLSVSKSPTPVDCVSKLKERIGHNADFTKHYLILTIFGIGLSALIKDFNLIWSNTFYVYFALNIGSNIKESSC